MIRWNISHRRVAAWLEEHWRFTSTDATHASVVIREGGVAASTDGLLRESTHLGGSVMWVVSPDETTCRVATSGDGVALVQQGAEWELLIAPRPEPGPSFYAALSIAITEGLRGSGKLPLHAAVVARGAMAIGITGPSGTGKSTALLQARHEGWDALAEDLAWIDDSLAVFSADTCVHLRPDMYAHLAAGLIAESALDGKHAVTIPFSRDRSARLAALVTLKRGAATFSMGPADPREAVRALWEASGVPLLRSNRMRAERTIQRLMTRLPVLEVRAPAGATAGEWLPLVERYAAGASKLTA